jgi:hypothetical protein
MDVDMTPTKDSFPKTAGIKTDEEGYFTTRGGMRVYVAPPFRERELKQPASSPPVLPRRRREPLRRELLQAFPTGSLDDQEKQEKP